MTALTGRFQAIGIRNATVQIVTSDSSLGIGYSGTIYLINEISRLDIQPDVTSVSVPGGDRLLSVTSVVTSCKFEMESGALDLALEAALTGDTVIDTGSSKVTLISTGTIYPYFRLEGRCDKLEGSGIGSLSDVHFVLRKAKLTSGIKKSHSYLKNSGWSAGGVAVSPYYVADPNYANAVAYYTQNLTGIALNGS